MAPYLYQKLNHELEEIRLLRLHPGGRDDQIRFDIFHVPLPQSTWRPSHARDSVATLQTTLPPGHVVKETLDGRYIFSLKSQEITPSSWDHPIPGFDRTRYILREDDYLPGPFYAPGYEALSYPWASQLLSTVGYVSSSSASLSEIKLGGNLASALKHLRYHDKSRVLWIDAICINQQDTAERNAQVKRMGRIYSLARRVIVWLGPESDGSTQALSTLQTFARQVELTTDNSLYSTPSASQPDWHYPYSALPDDLFKDTTWYSIKSLFDRPYFTRVWVVQEVTLANRFTVLHCGDYSMPWLDFKKAIGILRAKESTPEDIKHILDPHVPGVPPPTMRSLPRLLTFVGRKNCELPHDKIYGILSLASSNVQRLIEPRYDASAAWAFTDVSYNHLKLTDRLELLQFCTISSQYPGTPSWVPTWERRSKRALFGLRTGHIRQASGQSGACYSRLPEDALKVAGLRCACVKSVGSVAEGDVDQTFNVIRSWEPERLSSDTYQSGGLKIDAFLEAVFQGCLKDRFPRAVRWPTLAELRTLYLDLLSGTDRSSDIKNYLRNGVAEEATFFTTDKGYFGVAGRDVNEGRGDVVCILLGCDMPLLIRPTGGPDVKFLVVGVCFVPGLLDGEGLLGALPRNWELQFIFTDGAYVPTYIDTSTGHSQLQDPRLPPLDQNWALIAKQRTQDDPYFLQSFKDDTGRLVTSDPRLLPSALKERITLDHFILV